MRDQMAYLDSVQRAVRGESPRQSTAQQLELPMPQTQGTVRYEDAPDGMNLDEFLTWRNQQGLRSPVYSDEMWED